MGRGLRGGKALKERVKQQTGLGKMRRIEHNKGGRKRESYAFHDCVHRLTRTTPTRLTKKGQKLPITLETAVKKGKEASKKRKWEIPTDT